MAKQKMLMGAGLAALTVLTAGAVQAQSLSSNSASFNAGYGGMPGQENRTPDTFSRDANGNRVIIDGVIMTGSDQSTFNRTGAGSTVSGAGVGGSTAIGNNLSVITQGNWNTVIVDSTQINNGDVTAGVTVDTSGDPSGD